ncbi:hypothetical protein [Streptomyces sp. VRA16 Mangrove soil]|uniref:hypothetical protein n=1 Tax=Streptomyces sp. VRA16 Mangrove soil TaxID=2817434 RepID=UPI001A9FDA87|nr:hypothetical protein [Streptomyces sp. VRA16 Mangrove soil]MBO1336430.1 hypothetical protein [Streptomyces sp. VRA16 Mangrove soil]
MHSLVRDFPVVSLELGQRLHGSSGVQEAIQLKQHAEHFRSAAVRLEEQSRLPLRRMPEIREIVEALRDFARAAQRHRQPMAALELQDSVLIPAASGDRAEVAESLRLAEDLSAGWSKYESPPGWESTSAWLDWLADSAQDSAALNALVDQQVTKLGLAGLPVRP